jgi:NAD(P)-dependent dehydrogenase (short-subunit alcohol dehydrogenase family)
MKNISYQDKFDLDGNVAVVTGGAGIIGQHFCAGLAESGTKVPVVDLQEEKAQELAELLCERYESDVIGIGCNVAESESVKAMAEQVVDEFGKIDILHKNAAGKLENLDAFFAHFEEYSLDEWKKLCQ